MSGASECRAARCPSRWGGQARKEGGGAALGCELMAGAGFSPVRPSTG